jgi:hypothetical protein
MIIIRFIFSAQHTVNGPVDVEAIMNTIHLTETKLGLRKSAVLTLRGAAGLAIHCESGLLWVTLESDASDHWLRSGQCLTIRSQRRAVIEVIEDGEISLLRSPQREHSTHAKPTEWLPTLAVTEMRGARRDYVVSQLARPFTAPSL